MGECFRSWFNFSCLWEFQFSIFYFSLTFFFQRAKIMNFGRSSERQKYHIASLPMHEAKGEPEEEKYFPDIEHKVFCPGVFYPAPKKLFTQTFLLLSRNVARDIGIKPIMTATIENLLFSKSTFLHFFRSDCESGRVTRFG